MSDALKAMGRQIWRRVAGRPAHAILNEVAHLPLTSADTLLNAGPILVMAPHPDDESLGCGGLLSLAARAGVPVRIVFMTDGGGSHPGSTEYPPERLRDIRESEAIEAAGVLGFAADSVIFLRRPDGALSDHGSEGDVLVAEIVKEVRKLGAGLILSTWIFDGHADHITTARLAQRVARETGAKLYYYPIWGLKHAANTRLPSRSRIKGWRIEIGEALERKSAAIARHRSQMTDMIKDSTSTAPDAEVFVEFSRPFETYIEA